MSVSDLLIIFGGLAVSAGIAWFFWGPRRNGFRVTLATSGYQEAMVLVKGGYTPDVIIVQHGRPVRLNFRREESAACSEMVLLSDFGKSAMLPQGETVPVEFVPEQPGEYEFSCQMGMFRGTLVVE